MKRINEKVKDIVDVRRFQPLQDYTSDPAATLSAYHFTDSTSELMSKWLDRVVGVHDGQGHAAALAGYRGVGKSHFMATLAALVSQPDLRTKVTDAHVSASAQRLLRRRYPVVLVRRGTHHSLIEELKAGVATTFGLDTASLPDHVYDLLAFVQAKAGDVPFLVLVDTAMERTSRVSRDDGGLLAEIAEGIKSVNGFIGAALDDDIAGADGSNSAIVRSYAIDYLDQEHLYKVVDAFVFPKHQQLRYVLHDVYEYFREVSPTFRWSEQRFSSLYPLHPAILDVAPFVRLYVHNFALLSFAAEAGEKILGRPANSLIALDEVFDIAEEELRKVEDLHEAFEAFDRLNADVVAKIPVMQRLQAKLILKALLILSLEGQGTTSGEISSGMLIFDENDPKKALKTVEEIIRMFAAALPDDVRVYAEEGREIRYGLRVSSKDGLNRELDEAARDIEPGVVEEIIHRAFSERFQDSTFFGHDGNRKLSMESQLHWRGGLRRGRVIWRDQTASPASEAAAADDMHDWEVCIDLLPGDGKSASAANELPRAIWKTAPLKPEEIDSVKRYHVLQSDAKFREEHGEQIRGAIHSHALLLDRIVNRVFLEDGHLVIDNFDYNLTDEARSTTSLGALFSSMLEPLFETRYPSHPSFLKTLGLAEISTLVSDLYSGSRQKLAEVQQLAQTFALPLGLVKLSDGAYYPASPEHLRSLDPVRAVEAILNDASNGQVDLARVNAELRKPPLGLVREAQQLILSAMVSQRMIEFVTSKGDRINQRSLDLKIIWDDIIGLARPQESAYSPKKLVKWAAAITGDEGIKELSSDADYHLVRDGLAKWLEDWDAARILARFNALPEESLNTRIWRSVGRSSKTLGAAAALIRKTLENSIPLEECLGRISESFMDEPGNLAGSLKELETVRIYLDGFENRAAIRSYAVVAATTGVVEIEKCREAVFELLDGFDIEPDGDRERKISYAWQKFHREFSEHYVEQHDSVMRSHQLQADIEDIFRSDSWWLFDNLAELFGAGLVAVRSTFALKKMTEALNCTVKTRDLLDMRPSCRCGYDLGRHATWEPLADRLKNSIDSSLAELFNAMKPKAPRIAAALKDNRSIASSAELKTAADEIVKFAESPGQGMTWRIEHIQVLRLAMAARGGKPDAIGRRPAEPESRDDFVENAVEAEEAVLSVA